jgi:hypothetical protein
MLRGIAVALLSTLTAVTASATEYDHNQDPFGKPFMLPLGISLEEALAKMKYVSKQAPTVSVEGEEMRIQLDVPDAALGTMAPENYPLKMRATFKGQKLCSVRVKWRPPSPNPEYMLGKLVDQYGPPRIRRVGPSFVNDKSVEINTEWKLGNTTRGFAVYFYDLVDFTRVEMEHALWLKGC